MIRGYVKIPTNDFSQNAAAFTKDIALLHKYGLV